MSWLCLFFQCRWIWICNVESPHTVGRAGLWQCRSCKSISLGKTQ